ncbi:MAG TPA: ThiF family adenylyltransferase, partial [Rugosimonospora sp.]|nr:ThiF family adenylyltransferase [Rugosimonospora sp.]
MTPAADLAGPGVADRYYEELVTRNAGFVAPRSQHRLRSARVLVAGCGSTGGAAIEPLARFGVCDFVLADNGCYELNNLNRQHAGYRDVGRNKAVVGGDRLAEINPYARIETHEEGVTAANATALVSGTDVVIDGVDVTERSGWTAKYLLHEAASAARRPVLTGYDMAGTQYIRCYDYRTGLAPFAGRLIRSHVDTLDPWRLLRRVVPLRTVPLEMLENARTRLGDPDYSVPQLVYASLLFGALACRMVADLVDGRPVRRHVRVDVHARVRPTRTALAAALHRPVVLAR